MVIERGRRKDRSMVDSLLERETLEIIYMVLKEGSSWGEADGTEREEIIDSAKILSNWEQRASKEQERPALGRTWRKDGIVINKYLPMGKGVRKDLSWKTLFFLWNMKKYHLLREKRLGMERMMEVGNWTWVMGKTANQRVPQWPTEPREPSWGERQVYI